MYFFHILFNVTIKSADIKHITMQNRRSVLIDCFIGGTGDGKAAGQ